VTQVHAWFDHCRDHAQVALSVVGVCDGSDREEDHRVAQVRLGLLKGRLGGELEIEPLQRSERPLALAVIPLLSKAKATRRLWSACHTVHPAL
jgi:hypothetical protein